MTPTDMPEFAKALCLCFRMLNGFEPDDEKVIAWFEALNRHELGAVMGALEEHQTEAEKPPVVVDIVRRIKARQLSDGTRQAGHAAPSSQRKDATEEERLAALTVERARLTEICRRMGIRPPPRTSIPVCLLLERVRKGGRITRPDADMLEREIHAGNVRPQELAELARAGFVPKGEPCH